MHPGRQRARGGKALNVLQLYYSDGLLKARSEPADAERWSCFLELKFLQRSELHGASYGFRAVQGGHAYNRAVSDDWHRQDAPKTREDVLRPELPPQGRLLGLDVGARRIGVAVSDRLGITAQGLETLQRKNKRSDLEQLGRLIRDYQVREIVIGLPLRMSGLEGIQAEKMQAFAADLRKRFGLPVHLWDERLTSAEANRLLREADLSIEKRGKAVDRMAAVLILQGFMERRGVGG